MKLPVMILSFVATAVFAAEPLLEKIDLFEAGKDGYALYRIPGIVVTAKGTVLAYCEARKKGGDWDAIDIMLRRSTDGGKTWSERLKMADVPGPKPKNPVVGKLKGVKPEDVTYDNSVAIADRNGAVHFLFCLEYMRCFYIRSDDDGMTWTVPVEITAAFEKFRPAYDWKVIATGPGHGIQLKNGRLVVPVWLSLGTGGGAHRPSVAATIYSDDDGKSWQGSDIAVPNTPEFINPSETVVVQLADGRVMLNSRSESKAHRRLVTIGPDGAAGWSKPRFDDALLEPVCMASIVRFDEKRILFANPHTLQGRKNLSVKLSEDDGATWPVNKTLEDGFSAYSDLAVAKDGTVLCFYERGSTDGKSIYATGRLTVARFNLEWLTSNNTGLEFIDTSFENSSPLWYEQAADGTILVHLLYDHERSSSNRAAGHIHYLLHATPGAKLTLEFKNLDNVWNGKPGSVAKELKAVVISENGRDWKTVPTESLAENRIRLTVEMPGPRLYVARVEPYRVSDLDRLLASIRNHPLVRIKPIGKTVAGRELEIVRVGDPQAPYRVFLRARAHPWETAGNWVVQGLIQRLLKDADAKRFCVYILPMANKDGVARGMTRFNLQGKDLNRDWDKPADPQLAPENAALEKWLADMIKTGQRPHLAMEFHNDGSGKLHISRPPVSGLDRHLERMATLEALLRQHTWFTEGSTKAAFRNPGSLGDGWLERFGIDAVVHEFNCNWIAKRNEYPLRHHWETYGANLVTVFDEYFKTIKEFPQ